MSDPFMPIDFRQIDTGKTGTKTSKAEPANTSSVQGSSHESNKTNVQSDSVELSGKADLVNSLLTDLASRPVVNQSKIEQLRSSIASGEFTVSADKIANNIIALDNSLRKLTQ